MEGCPAEGVSYRKKAGFAGKSNFTQGGITAMKRALAILLAAAMAVSVAGCSGSESSSSQASTGGSSSVGTSSASQAAPSESGSGSDETVSKVYEWPLVSEPTELTVFTKLLPQVEDFDTNKTTQWYEEKTGVHINWIQVPSADFTTQLNLSYASDDWPDVYACELSTDQLLMMRNGGVIEPLEDLLDNYAYWANQIFKDHPEYKD